MPWADTDPLQYLAVGWGPAEAALLVCKVGSPDGQARWEAYTALLAVAAWLDLVTDPCVDALLVGDALGVLHGAVALHSQDPIINKVFGEIALLLAPSGASLGALHWWSEENAIADALSRLPQGAGLPGCCRRAQRREAHGPVWPILGARVR